MKKNIYKFPKTQRTIINNLIKTGNKNKKTNSDLAMLTYIKAINLLVEEMNKSDKIIKTFLEKQKVDL